MSYYDKYRKYKSLYLLSKEGGSYSNDKKYNVIKQAISEEGNRRERRLRSAREMRRREFDRIEQDLATPSEWVRPGWGVENVASDEDERDEVPYSGRSRPNSNLADPHYVRDGTWVPYSGVDDTSSDDIQEDFNRAVPYDTNEDNLE